MKELPRFAEAIVVGLIGLMITIITIHYSTAPTSDADKQPSLFECSCPNKGI
jgi:hypothetical protein